MRKKLFYFISLSLLLVILLFVSVKKNWWKTAFDFYSKSTPPRSLFEFRNITLSGWHKGKKQWQIKAEYVEVSKDRRITTFHKIISGYFYKDKKEVLIFKGEKAVYDSLTSNLEISGNIEIVSKENLILNTSYLFWDANKKILKTSAKVTLTFENNILTASSLVADEEMEIIDLKDVFISLEIEELKKKLKIEG